MGDIAFDFSIVRDGVPQRLRFHLDLSLYSHSSIYSFLSINQPYEPVSSMLVLNGLPKGGTFIDVGAHIGFFSMIAAITVGPQGRVFSFEPDRSNHDRLLRHIQENNLSQIMPFNWAVNDRQGIVELFLEDTNDGGHAIWDITPLLQAKRQTKVEVPHRPVFATTLDTLLGGQGPGSIHGMKIDVEGAEMHVLTGARNLLASAKIPFIICECHRERLAATRSSEPQLRDFMTGLGYDVYADSPEQGKLVKLQPGEVLQTNYIFNLVFMMPEFASAFFARESATPSPK